MRCATDPDGLFVPAQHAVRDRQREKIGRLSAIVVEASEHLNRGNSPSNSRAQISDGSGRRFFMVCRKNLCAEFNALRSLGTIEWE
jgi:hypothetical protein